MEALAAPAAIRLGRPKTQRVDLDDWVARARAGDVGAFEEIYRATVARVHGLCLRMCRDPHLAEEMVQESYIRAWQKLATFRGESQFTSWLHRLAVNVVLSHFRSSGRRLDRLAEGELDGVESVAARAPGLAVDLDRAIARLPDGARTVLVLHDVEGYTHEEIARLMDVAVGTSKAQLNRARSLLRKVLSP